MMYVMHPTYTIRLEIQDRLRQDSSTSISVGHDQKPHKYFDGVAGKSGCSEVTSAVKDALEKAGIANVVVSLERFEHKA